MPPVRHLGRIWGAVAGGFGVGASPVPADHRCAGMRLQPRLHGGCLPVRQQVHHVAGSHVHQHGRVYVPLAQREVIDPERLRRGGDLRYREGLDQAQHRGRVHGDAQQPGQPGSGPPGQLQAGAGQHLRQRHAAPAIPAGHAVGLLGEGDRRALRVPAAEPAHLQGDQHRPPARRTIGHQPRVPTVDLRRLLPAPQAARRLRPAGCRDHHRVPRVLHPVHAQPGQVREQHGQQVLAPVRNFPDADGGSGRPGRRHGRLIRQRGSRVR